MGTTERVLGISGCCLRTAEPAAMLAQLHANGADVAEATDEMGGVGRFGWVTDPEGNRVELWQLG